MTIRSFRRPVPWLLIATLLTLAGCTVVTDLFNPGLMTQLGVSTGGSTGVVVVAFNNQTSFPATFFAYESFDSADLSRDSRNFSAEVAANEVANEVLECPVELISPGSLGEGFTPATLAANVTDDAGVTAINYTGPALAAPDFTCGDLIEIRLTMTATGEDANEFQITMAVIPG